MSRLPIYEVAHKLITTLSSSKKVVLSAPPGAGKTTIVPIELLKYGGLAGKILLLEPRRIAAKAAADRMSKILNEPIGQTVGYRFRGEQKCSEKTSIEVITEGILTRMIQSNPYLPDVSAVIFDEFHERSLNSDLGLALCLEITEALRDDLLILVMSATLDSDAISKLLGSAPVIFSKGKNYDVKPIWMEKPKHRSSSFKFGIGTLVEEVASKHAGGILVFLPGEKEIKEVSEILENKLPKCFVIHKLFSSLPFARQLKAISPQKKGRKIVLATSIAETSLTIEDINIVVDSGLARRACFDSTKGMSSLITEKITKSEATQRMGRAGRLGPGICYKFWSKLEEGSLRTSIPPEINYADLSKFALEISCWGTEPSKLSFLNQPDPKRYSKAIQLLKQLEAIDEKGRITKHGREISKLPVHPRLGHMLLRAGIKGAELASIIEERDPIIGEKDSDLNLRLNLINSTSEYTKKRTNKINYLVLERIKKNLRKLRPILKQTRIKLTTAQMAALAYPDRIGARRGGEKPRYLLSGGMGAKMKDNDYLGKERFIVAIELDGVRKEATIRQALAITASEIKEIFKNKIILEKDCSWSKRDQRISAREYQKLGAISIKDKIWENVPNHIVSHAMLEGIREVGLHLTEKEIKYLNRLKFAGGKFEKIVKKISDPKNWELFIPFISSIRSVKEWQNYNKLPILKSLLNFEESHQLESLAPSVFVTPKGRKIPIDYSQESPEISVKIQELYGQRKHPVIAGLPIKITLLSPAKRPIQTTSDISAFWSNSYTAIRKEMRGRYPKHSWPQMPE